MIAKPTSIRGLSELALEYSGQAASANEPAALIEALYVEHFSAIYRYLIFTGSNAADADEIVQEAFLRLFQALRNGQKIERPKQWLVAVAHNFRLSQVEKTARTAEADVRYQIGESPTQEETLIQEERLLRVKSAMARLTSRQQTYLHLRAEGLRLKEIAEIHGVTIQSVAEACARAIQTLGVLSNE